MKMQSCDTPLAQVTGLSQRTWPPARPGASAPTTWPR